MASIYSLWDGSGTAAPQNLSDTGSGRVKMTLATGEMAHFENPPDSVTGRHPSYSLVAMVADALNDLATKTMQVKNDVDLSPKGKENKLLPVQKGAFNTAHEAAKMLRRQSQAVDEREQRLFAIPKPNQNLPGPSIRAWECREYFRSLDAAKQGEFLAKTRAGNQEVVEVLAALLDSPYSLEPKMLEAIQSSWQAARREQNQPEAQAIDSDRRTIAWAISTVTVLAMTIMQLSKIWGKQQIAEFVMDAGDSYPEVFGLHQSDIDKAKRMKEAV